MSLALSLIASVFIGKADVIAITDGPGTEAVYTAFATMPPGEQRQKFLEKSECLGKELPDGTWMLIPKVPAPLRNRHSGVEISRTLQGIFAGRKEPPTLGELPADVRGMVDDLMRADFPNGTPDRLPISVVSTVALKVTVNGMPVEVRWPLSGPGPDLPGKAYEHFSGKDFAGPRGPAPSPEKYKLDPYFVVRSSTDFRSSRLRDEHNRVQELTAWYHEHWKKIQQEIDDAGTAFLQALMKSNLGLSPDGSLTEQGFKGLSKEMQARLTNEVVLNYSKYGFGSMKEARAALESAKVNSVSAEMYFVAPRPANEKNGVIWGHSQLLRGTIQ